MVRFSPCLLIPLLVSSRGVGPKVPQQSDKVSLIQASTKLSVILNPEANASVHPHRGDQEQSVHWVFTTDCSAYMFNQGNLMLASAYHVGQKGQFTWIVTNGCERKEQKDALKKLAHPDAKVWYAPKEDLLDSRTGEKYREFQASNRPKAVAAWYRDTKPKEDAIGILDPDMTWLRPVDLLQHPSKGDKKGNWATAAATPKNGVGAKYGQGCVPNRWSDTTMLEICGDAGDACVSAKNNNNCEEQYSSGPPWILHRSDAESVYGTWSDTMVNVHKVWPDLLSEQVSYGVAEMKNKVNNKLDTFWFLSDTGDREQPWNFAASADYDPCESRAPPSKDLQLPPIWHACSTYEIPHLLNQGFRIHKNHIHKDILACDAPLLHYAPKDALKHYANDKSGEGFKETWSVCTYTNLVNFYSKSWKEKFCDNPNLNATFSYPDHEHGFLLEGTWLEKTFRKGGWGDVDYAPN